VIVSTETAEIRQLISLVHHRWNIPVVAELHRSSGAKFVTLVNRLGVGRASLSSSLEHLIGLGIVERNVGHGHPMRPEYLLTAAGTSIGADCLALFQTLQRRDEADIALRKWTLPLVAAIGDQLSRFNDLKAALNDATPRAITLGLKTLIQRRWAARTLIDEFPPTAGYELRPKGQRILTYVHDLCW
jgi:DNA-binding HxlR family transcriptional regulator